MLNAPVDNEIAVPRATPRALALVCAVVAAQSAFAAGVWAACLAVGLLAHRLATRPAAGTQALPAPRDPAEPPRPARRRGDRTTPTGGRRPLAAEPLLKVHRDNLTDLCTTESLANTAEYLAQDMQAREQTLCVLYVGLDGFTPLVESYGREASHQVLIQVDRRLRHLTRREDKVLRLGDTEFALLIGGPAGDCKSFLFTMKARVIAELQRTYSYRTLSNLRINCSVGHAIHPQDGTTGAELVAHAAASLAEARSRLVLSRQAQFA